MTATSIVIPTGSDMLAGKHSLRVPVIAPRIKGFALPSPPESSPLKSMSLGAPPRIRLPPRSRTGCW